MDPLNPYQAPQATLAYVLQPGDPEFTASILGPEWPDVCNGARRCALAIRVVIYSILFGILGGIVLAFILGPLSAIITQLAVIVGIIASVIIQTIGLVQLRKVDSATGAKGFLTVALALQISYWLFVIATNILQYLGIDMIAQNAAVQNNNQPTSVARFRELFFTYSIIQIIQNIILLAYNVALFLGMRRIGVILGDSKIKNLSMSALATMITLIMAGMGLTIFGVITAINNKMNQRNNMETSFILLVVGLIVGYLVMIGFYGSALTRIANYAKSNFIPLPRTNTPSVGSIYQPFPVAEARDM
jgi:uncharacterized membrane protein